MGEYKNGKENGFGEWSDLDGQTYTGEFKDGEFDGKGISNFPDGGSYQGEFVEGRIAVSYTHLTLPTMFEV